MGTYNFSSTWDIAWVMTSSDTYLVVAFKQLKNVLSMENGQTITSVPVYTNEYTLRIFHNNALTSSWKHVYLWVPVAALVQAVLICFCLDNINLLEKKIYRTDIPNNPTVSAQLSSVKV